MTALPPPPPPHPAPPPPPPPQVYVHAPDSMEVVTKFTAHTAGMCDMDVVGYYLITCGLTQQSVALDICAGSGYP